MNTSTPILIAFFGVSAEGSMLIYFHFQKKTTEISYLTEGFSCLDTCSDSSIKFHSNNYVEANWANSPCMVIRLQDGKHRYTGLIVMNLLVQSGK